MRASLLLVTDLLYPAQGRRYGDEDAWLAGRLREELDVALCSPLDAAALLERFDLVLVRNSGPVLHHRAAWEAFRERALASGAVVVNDLRGEGDMQGKGYLVRLTRAGAPVIPTVDRREDLPLLPEAERYVVKPLLGADSVGLQVLARDALPADLDGLLVQPLVPFRYEVSFVFVDRVFAYALHAPDPAQRWRLVPYAPDAADLAFAQPFVDANPMAHGVQRVDACRTQDGGLLLVELEDLNPYLSLDLLDEPVRERFVAALRDCLRSALRDGPAGRS